MGKTLNELFKAAAVGIDPAFVAMKTPLFHPNGFPDNGEFSQSNFTIIINEFMRRFSSMSTLYDTVEEFHTAFHAWTRSRTHVWEKLLDTMKYVYDPIYNYDRFETVEEARSSRHSEDTTSTSTQTSNAKATGSDERSDERSTLNKVYAWNSDTPADKDSETMTTQNTGRSSGSSSGSSQSDDTGRSQGVADEKYQRTVRTYGNIGVTTTQQMIASERETVLFSLINQVCDEFKTEFLIMIY